MAAMQCHQPSKHSHYEFRPKGFTLYRNPCPYCPGPTSCNCKATDYQPPNSKLNKACTQQLSICLLVTGFHAVLNGLLATQRASDSCMPFLVLQALLSCSVFYRQAEAKPRMWKQTHIYQHVHFTEGPLARGEAFFVPLSCNGTKEAVPGACAPGGCLKNKRMYEERLPSRSSTAKVPKPKNPNTRKQKSELGSRWYYFYLLNLYITICI